MKNDVAQPETLSGKAVRGVKWTVATNAAVQLSNFTAGVILYNVLDIDLFGIMAMVYLVLEGFLLFQDVGFLAALLQRRDRVREAANIAFAVRLGLNALLFGIIFLVAPLLATYGFAEPEPELTAVLRVMSIGLLLDPLSSVHQTMLRKKMQFKRIFFPETIGSVAYLLVGSTLALTGFGIWSIVLASLTQRTVRTVVYWVSYPWIPTRQLDYGLAREMLRYGKHVFGGSIVMYFIFHLDDILVGKFLGKDPLAFYSFAYRISMYPTRLIRMVLNRVLFPAYAEIQEDLERVGNAWLKVLTYVTLVSAPATFVLMLVAHVLITGVYSEKWLPAVHVFQILLFFGFNRSIGSTMGELFKAIGKPRILFISSIVQLVTIVPFALYSLRFDIVGVSILWTFGGVIGNVYAFWHIMKVLDIRVAQIARSLMPALTATAGTCAVIAVWQQTGLHNVVKWDLLNLFVCLGLAGLTYVAVVVLFFRDIVDDMMMRLRAR